MREWLNFKWADNYTWIVKILTRISVGWVFVESGWGKLQHLDKTAEFFAGLGIPIANIQAPFVAGVEVICGALLIAGFFSRLASIPLVFTMIVAIATAHRESISTASDLLGMAEFLFILLLLYIICYGPGRLSVNRK